MHRVRMLIHFGITPYLVFDGDYLPSKASTEGEREKKRAESKRVGLELCRMGKPSQAYLELQKAVDVTPEMARQLIEELKRHKIKYVVAPYEADAQLAYLERKNIIQGVISEDSDLLVFGVKRLLTKLDQYGECVEINRADFTACKDISLVGWSDVEFRRMAILSGCDYLNSINKLGLKTAYRLVRRHKTIEKIIRMLQFDGQYRVPEGYLEDFRKAELTFLHQRVFCPVEQRLVTSVALEGPEPAEFDFIGKHVEAEVAIGVANGNLHPMTKKPIFCKAKPLTDSPSPWKLARSKTIGTPSDLKLKKPIDAFFKPKRVPLAELDPNSFTPSPRQQRVLEEQEGSFLSTPVAASPSTSQPALSSSRSFESRIPRSRAALSSVDSNPSKRARLCDETDVKASDGFGTSDKWGRSRFFASTAPEPSPSLKKASKAKKGAAVNIWSDDSIDDVLVDLPDVQDSTGSRGVKGQIFCDSQVKVKAIEGRQNEGVANPKPSSDSKLFHLSSLETATTVEAPVSSATSVTKSRSPIEVEKPKLPKTLNLAEKFSFGRFSPPTIPDSPESSGPSFKSGTQPSTICDSPDTADEKREASQIPRLRYFGTSSTGQSKESIVNVQQSPVQPKRLIIRGSEEDIVPNSEDESGRSCDEATENSAEEGSPPRLNLEKYAFNG